VDWSGCLVFASLDGGNIRGADLAGADLSGADLSGADLSSADLSSAHLDSANLTAAKVNSASLVGADLRGATAGSETQFFASDLTGALLANVDWKDSDFRFSTLTNADLDAAVMGQAKFATIFNKGGVVGTPDSLPAGWLLAYGFILGPTAYLTGSDLSGLDLSGLDMRGVALDYTNMTNANLDGTQLLGASMSYITSGGVVGTPASLPQKTKLRGGFLLDFGSIVPGADFSGSDMRETYLLRGSAPGSRWVGTNLRSSVLGLADLSGADFHNANLEATNLGGADLTGANLSGANLYYAYVDSGTDFTGVTWTGATCMDGYKAEQHVGGSCLGKADPLPPAVRLLRPSATYSLDKRVLVSWSAVDAGTGVAASSVRYTRAPATGGAASAWIYPTGWSAVTGSSITFSGTTGYRYCFSVRSRDKLGNVSAWTPSRCTTTPRDDRSLAVKSGSWTRSKATGYLNGTYSQASRRGSTLVSSSELTVRQVGVTARRCPTCGAVALYVDGVRQGVISLYSPTVVKRAVVMLPRLTTQWRGRIKIVVVTSGKSVRLDGVVVSSR
jgi:uncharacterized protein YjbI with pentapeptide repeats